MAEEKVDETDWKAVNMLTDRFSLCPEHIQDFLELASGDQVIVESAPLVVRELGEGSLRRNSPISPRRIGACQTNKKT